MKALRLLAWVLTCCGAGEAFSDVMIDFGQNVTVDCELDVREFYWFKQETGSRPVVLLRTFNGDAPEGFYFLPGARRRYSVSVNGSLLIHNASASELGVYYCVQSASPLHFSNGTRLYTEERLPVAQSEDLRPNCSIVASPPPPPPPSRPTKWQTLTLMSFIINCVLFVTVAVLTNKLARHKRVPDPL